MSERKYDGRHAGGGDAGFYNTVNLVDVGACPSCNAPLSRGTIPDPRDPTKTVEGLFHEMPFCNYYGETPPEQIMADVRAKAEVS